MDTYDFMGIGDTVADDFINIDQAEVNGEPDTPAYKICLPFGDKIPYVTHEILYAVGNSPNASVSAARLGRKTALLSTLGSDERGDLCIASLKTNNVSTEYISRDPSIPTNFHFVLWKKPERTILIKHFDFPRSMPANLPAPKWVYLSSLGANTEQFHDEILVWLTAHPEIQLAFQPGTFQMKLGTERLKGLYARTQAFFCNLQEAQRILQITESDPKKLMDGIFALGPRIVVVTDGMKGAYAREENGTCWYMPIYPNSPDGPLERTGAGDSFSSTFAVAISLGKTVPEALLWAPINAMSVTEQVGAQRGLLTQTQIEEYLAKAPADYKPKQM